MINVNNKTFTFNPSKEINVLDETRVVFYDMVKSCFSRIEVIPPFGQFEISKNDFDSHMQYKFKYQIKKDKKWQDFTKYNYLPLEQRTSDGLKYIYYHEENSPYLVVVFQALNKVPSYNYINTLAKVPLSKLYIKDDYGLEPTHATYYLGQNKSFDIATKVNNLINEARIYNKIDAAKVICAGSSKGGFAAIYHSILGDFGYCIAGGPQIFLGKYLGKNLANTTSSVLTPIFNYLTGGLDEYDKEWADNIIPNLLNEKIGKGKNQLPNTFIHVGKEEPHYYDHVLPLYNMVLERKLKNMHLDLGDYDKHEELARFFPVFLKKMVLEITNVDK